MGAETIDNIGEQIGDAGSDGYSEVIKQALRAAEVRTSTHIDGGWGASIGEHEVINGAAGISYAGEIPAKPKGSEPGFRPFPTLP